MFVIGWKMLENLDAAMLVHLADQALAWLAEHPFPDECVFTRDCYRAVVATGAVTYVPDERTVGPLPVTHHEEDRLRRRYNLAHDELGELHGALGVLDAALDGYAPPIGHRRVSESRHWPCAYGREDDEEGQTEFELDEITLEVSESLRPGGLMRLDARWVVVDRVDFSRSYDRPRVPFPGDLMRGPVRAMDLPGLFERPVLRLRVSWRDRTEHPGDEEAVWKAARRLYNLLEELDLLCGVRPRILGCALIERARQSLACPLRIVQHVGERLLPLLTERRRFEELRRTDPTAVMVDVDASFDPAAIQL